LPHADFVIITAPHTTATDCLIGAQELALMKSGAGLVNYSRSKLVDYEALRAELSAGRLSAVLDVFDSEPLASDSPLWSTPNLLVTPHCCSNDPENHAPRSLDILFDNVARLADGRALRNVVDPALQY
jgi:phosphoglycerate dehydrogenase-like enzyme